MECSSKKILYRSFLRYLIGLTKSAIEFRVAIMNSYAGLVDGPDSFAE